MGYDISHGWRNAAGILMEIAVHCIEVRARALHATVEVMFSMPLDIARNGERAKRSAVTVEHRSSRRTHDDIIMA